MAGLQRDRVRSGDTESDCRSGKVQTVNGRTDETVKPSTQRQRFCCEVALVLWMLMDKKTMEPRSGREEKEFSVLLVLGVCVTMCQWSAGFTGR